MWTLGIATAVIGAAIAVLVTLYVSISGRDFGLAPLPPKRYRFVRPPRPRSARRQVAAEPCKDVRELVGVQAAE